MAHLAGPSSGGVPWHFHPRILSHIGNNFTVPQLKESLRDLGLRISGNKPELHNRLRDAIQDYYHRGDAARWEMARRVVASQTTNGTFDWMKDIQNAPVKQPAAPGYGGGGGGGAPTGAGAYTPSNVAAATATRSAPATQPNFKPSPFYRIHEWASTSTLLLPCTPSEGRKAALLRMNVRADHAQLVKDQPDKYKYRLFVAPKPAWDASASRTGAAHPCFIDFPFGSELFVNSTKYAGALKGSKKHAGRVPPPDLSKGLLFMDPNKPNSIEVRYQTDRSGSHAPTSHAMAIALCRVTSPEELAANLAKERTHSKEKVIAGMKRAADDDEIEAGAQTFRFKCPLSYMTIKTPARATTCPHVQTFDAGAFYSLNETSPVWQCPVCSSDIRHEDLFVDGFCKDILERVPESAERVLIEPDGKWRTEDGKFTSTSTSTTSTEVEADLKPAAEEPHSGVVPRNGSRDTPSSTTTRKRQRTPDVMVLDDSPELAASAPEVAASAHGVAASAHVIDLTLDSDDDDDDRPLSATVRPPPARARQSSDTPLASGSGSGIANAHANANANAHAPTPRLAAPLRPAALPQHLARHVNAAGRSLPRHESSAMSSVSNGVHDDARPRAGTSAGTMSSNPPEEDEEPLRAGKRQKPSGSGNANLTADDSMELSIRGRAAARSDADADAAAAADSSATASFHSARSWDATGTANYSLGSSNLPHRSEAWDMVDEDEEMEAALRWDDANDDMDVGATRTRTFL